jgi:hypothetical protein
MELNDVRDGRGRSLRWQRDFDRLWILAPDTSLERIEFTFYGRPRMVNRNLLDHSRRHRETERGITDLVNPLFLPPVQSGQRRWLVDLEGLSWAPEPLWGLDEKARYGGMSSCWGSTTLDLRLPSRLVPVPIPGEWKTESRDGTTEAHWRGRSLFLPPVVGGHFYIVEKAGEPSVTVVLATRGTDSDGLIDKYLEAWDERGGGIDTAGFVLRPAKRFYSGLWCAPASLLKHIRLDPPLATPLGLIHVNRETMSLRRKTFMESWYSKELTNSVILSRARLLFEPIAYRLRESGGGFPQHLLWRLSVALGIWPPPPGTLEVVAGPWHHAVSVREIDLDGPAQPTASYWERYKIKLNFVSLATLSLLGPERVEEGLEALGAGQGALDVDEIWRALAGGRAQELGWFKEQMLLGKGLAKPLLQAVEVEERSGNWKITVAVINEGDAYLPVPVRIYASNHRHTVTIPVEAGRIAEASLTIDEPPDQILLDPDCEVLRQRLKSGDSRLRWTRKEGIR